MNERFGARLCLGLFVASLLLLPIFPLFLPPFVGPVVGTAFVTLAHIILGLFYYFRLTRDLRVGLCALLGAASWATWVWCYWEEYSAQMSLPNINIAGLIAPIATLLTILFLSSDSLKFGSTSRSGKRYFAVGVAFTVLVLVEVLWTFLFQEQLAEPAMSPDMASLVTVIILRRTSHSHRGYLGHRAFHPRQKAPAPADWRRSFGPAELFHPVCHGIFSSICFRGMG